MKNDVFASAQRKPSAYKNLKRNSLRSVSMGGLIIFFFFFVKRKTPISLKFNGLAKLNTKCYSVLFHSHANSSISRSLPKLNLLQQIFYGVKI